MPAELAATRTDDVVSTTVGAYRLGRVIGSGGSSVVYQAIPERRSGPPSTVPSTVRATVAVKLAIRERCTDPEFCRSFRQQSRVAAVVDHPGVLPVLDGGEQDGRPYLVLPHVQGADLRLRLLGHGLSVGRILVLLRQVADGLDAMHVGGVLHLDVKPANVLVGRIIPAGHPVADRGGSDRVEVGAGESGAERAYLTDLGLCRFLTDRPERRSPDFVGSPRFSSPEHLRGRTVRPSSDVYSLACLLFACLAGQPPYTGGVPTIVTGHLSGRVPSLAAVTGLPRRLDQVIRRGMHPDPGSRYPSCAELVDRARLAVLGTPA